MEDIKTTATVMAMHGKLAMMMDMAMEGTTARSKCPWWPMQV